MMKKIAFVFLFCILGLTTAGYSQAKDTLVENGCKYVMHDVQKGQTLYGLAKQYRLTVERLVEDNPGTENGIRIGQQLKIYAGQAEVVQKHVVSKGESLYKISKMYGVTVAQLTAWNPGLTERLDIGQEIIVRKSVATVAPKPQQPAVRREPVTAQPLEPERVPQVETVVEKTETHVEETSKVVSVAERKQVYNVFLLLPLYTQEGVHEDDGQKVDTLEAYERIKSFDFIQAMEVSEVLGLFCLLE